MWLWARNAHVRQQLPSAKLAPCPRAGTGVRHPRARNCWTFMGMEKGGLNTPDFCALGCVGSGIPQRCSGEDTEGLARSRGSACPVPSIIVPLMDLLPGLSWFVPKINKYGQAGILQVVVAATKMPGVPVENNRKFLQEKGRDSQEEVCNPWENPHVSSGTIFHQP